MSAAEDFATQFERIVELAPDPDRLHAARRGEDRVEVDGGDVPAADDGDPQGESLLGGEAPGGLGLLGVRGRSANAPL